MLLTPPFPLILEDVQSDLLHKYQSKDDVLILTVRLAVIVAVILTVPVLFFTVSAAGELLWACLSFRHQEPGPEEARGRSLSCVS